MEAPGGFEPPVFAVLQTAPFGHLRYGATLVGESMKEKEEQELGYPLDI
jgi:hypothetical protein